jgi:hypothetical protein
MTGAPPGPVPAHWQLVPVLPPVPPPAPPVPLEQDGAAHDQPLALHE